MTRQTPPSLQVHHIVAVYTALPPFLPQPVIAIEIWKTVRKTELSGNNRVGLISGLNGRKNSNCIGLRT